MTFLWAQYYDVAEFLRLEARADLKEAFFRSAVSRAYYFAYHSALRVAIQQGFQISGADCHRQLIDHFRNRPERICKRVSDDLNALRFCRVEADYKSNTTVSFNSVEATLIKAKKLQELLDKDVPKK